MRDSGEGVTLRIRVQPGARKNEVVGFQGDVLKLRVAAPPVEGKANRACRELLAEILGLSRSSIEITAGEMSRDKVVRVRGISREEVEERLLVGSLAREGQGGSG